MGQRKSFSNSLVVMEILYQSGFSNNGFCWEGPEIDQSSLSGNSLPDNT